MKRNHAGVQGNGPGGTNYLSAVQVRGGPWIGGVEGLASLSTPAKDPVKDPPELLQRIAEAAAVVEGRRLLTDAALDSALLADEALHRAKDCAEMERRLAEKRAAQEAYHAARSALEYAVAALNTLYVERRALRARGLDEVRGRAVVGLGPAGTGFGARGLPGPANAPPHPSTPGSPFESFLSGVFLWGSGRS